MQRFQLFYLSFMAIAFFALTLTCHTVSPEKEFRPLLELYLHAWNTGEVEVLDKVAHPQFELRMSPQFQPRRGLDSLKYSIKTFRIAYPDFHIVVEELIFAEQAITGRWTITATNSGPGIFPPTGKKVHVQGMSILHVEHGKIKDEWVFGNDLWWLQQLGFKLVPAETL